MSVRPSRSQLVRLVLAAALVLVECLAALAPLSVEGKVEQGGAGTDAVTAAAAADVGHLLVSEVMTGGASASDEFVELYNPTAAPLPLEGLELVYVTASGATITRKASWPSGAPSVPAGAHLLIANDAGIFAPLADALYTNGLAAAGGSVAIRIQGAATAIDAIGWGTAASSWLEGSPAPAPAAGSSLERLPGGPAGSGQDTGVNLVDFVVRAAPDPQNAASAPIASSASPTATGTPTAAATPSATPTATPTQAATSSPTEPTQTPAASDSASGSPSPTPTAAPVETPSPTPTPPPTLTPNPTASPTPVPSASPISIAAARALADGATATVAGVALMSSDFVDGGGCLADGSAGIAVLPTGSSFARGDVLGVTGTVDDRYAQRTLRVAAGDLSVQGVGDDPVPIVTATGSIGEAVECQVVEIAGTVAGSPTSLASGLAFDVDDGTGSVRVLVAPVAAIDTGAWVQGSTITVIGVVGQRDSSGTGTAGYRVMPRDPADVLGLVPPATPAPTASPSATRTSTPSVAPTPTQTPTAVATSTPAPSPAPGLVTIAAARLAPTGTPLHVRGVVTLGTGLVDGQTAVIQDGSGAIVLRLGDEAGGLRRGILVDVLGVRSTRSGMVTLRVDAPPVGLGSQAEPAALRVRTVDAIEPREAQLLVVRGAITSAPVKSSAGNSAFTVDDGSGPLRVTVFAGSSIATASLAKGSWIELRGVLGQQTTGAQPDRGYRLWPRDPADAQILASPSLAASRPAPSNETGSAQVAGAAVSSRSSGPLAGTGDGPSDTAGGDVASVPAPGLGARATNDGIGAGDAAGGGSPAAFELASQPVDRRPAAALLLGALALATATGAAAWRTGALGRLREVLAWITAGTAEPADPEAAVR